MLWPQRSYFHWLPLQAEKIHIQVTLYKSVSSTIKHSWTGVMLATFSISHLWWVVSSRFRFRAYDVNYIHRHDCVRIRLMCLDSFGWVFVFLFALWMCMSSFMRFVIAYIMIFWSFETCFDVKVIGFVSWTLPTIQCFANALKHRMISLTLSFLQTNNQ